MVLARFCLLLARAKSRSGVRGRIAHGPIEEKSPLAAESGIERTQQWIN